MFYGNDAASVQTIGGLSFTPNSNLIRAMVEGNPAAATFFVSQINITSSIPILNPYLSLVELITEGNRVFTFI